MLMLFKCGDAVNKIPTLGVAVISNHTVCDVCIFHAAVFSEMKLFAVIGCFDLPFSSLNLTLLIHANLRQTRTIEVNNS